MKYGKFKSYLERIGSANTFVVLCLKRVEEIESRFGCDVETLVASDDAMLSALKDLEWKVEKNDLDNYQNALKHYFYMVHKYEFLIRVQGNRRLKD